MAPGKPGFLGLPTFKRKRDEAFPSASVPPLSRALPSAGPSAEGASMFTTPPAAQASKSLGLETAKPPQPLHNKYEAAPLDFEVVDPDRVPWCRPPPVRAMKKGAGKLLRFVLGNDDGEGEQGMYQLGRGEPSVGGKIYFDRDLRRRLEVTDYTPPPGTLGIDRFGLPAPVLPYFVRDVHSNWKPVKASRWMYLSADPPAGTKAGDVAPRPRPEDLPIGEVASSKGKDRAMETEQEVPAEGDHVDAASSVSDYGTLTWTEVAGDPPSSNVLVVSGMEGTMASITEGEGLATLIGKDTGSGQPAGFAGRVGRTLIALQAQPVSIIRSQGQTFFDMVDVSAALRAVYPLRRLWPQAVVEFTPKDVMDRAWERLDELWMPEVEEGEVTSMDVDVPLVQPGPVNESRLETANRSHEASPSSWKSKSGSVAADSWGRDSGPWGEWDASPFDDWTVASATSGWDLPGPGDWSARETGRELPPSHLAEPSFRGSEEVSRTAITTEAGQSDERATSTAAVSSGHSGAVAEETIRPPAPRVATASKAVTPPSPSPRAEATSKAASTLSDALSSHVAPIQSTSASSAQHRVPRVIKPLPTGPRAHRPASTTPSAPSLPAATRTDTPSASGPVSASSPPALLSRLRDPRPLLGRLSSRSLPDAPVKSLLERIASTSGCSPGIREPSSDIAPPRAVKRKSAKRRERDVARAIRRQGRVLSQVTEPIVCDTPMATTSVAAAPSSTGDKHAGRTAIKTFANDTKFHVYYSIRVSMSSVWLIREIFGWGHWTWRWGNSQRCEKVGYQDWSPYQPRGAPSMVINRRHTIKESIQQKGELAISKG
ncbi:hypothetical protein GGX14DRAFT_403263 [Mycena pura]|uniref:Uncharacterized protein n=1 Tax=Mycena pura TaxID=153505 RepID=A0AAD6V0B2_9AGAR|nr:hypothetical protein GGX14DRAFT_403263 [Mycena pura]